LINSPPVQALLQPVESGKDIGSFNKDLIDKKAKA